MKIIKNIVSTLPLILLVLTLILMIIDLYRPQEIINNEPFPTLKSPRTNLQFRLDDDNNLKKGKEP